MTPQTISSAAEPHARWPHLSIVALALLMINVGIYAYQGLRGVPWIDPSPEQQIAWGGNLALLTLTGDGWRLGTSMFLHGGLLHLVMNMYMLTLLGPIAERRLGRIGMLLTYLAGGLAASCLSAWWLGSHSFDSNLLGQPVVRLVVSVGASGALMALTGALLMTSLVRMGSIDGPSPSDAAIGKSLAQVIAINVGMGFALSGVDNAAHIGGLLAGFAMSMVSEVMRRVSPKVTRLARAGVPVLFGAATVSVTLYACDWPELHELRPSYEEEQESVRRKLDAAQERQGLPAPVEEVAARGQIVQFGQSGTSFALSADEKTAYTVDHYRNEISVIDLTRGVVARKITGPSVPPEQFSSRRCVGMFCGAPAAVDIALLSSKPWGLVTSMQEDAVVFIDLAEGRMMKTVAVGKTPNAVLLSADDKRAYVHNVGEHSISVLDVETASVVHTLRLPWSFNQQSDTPGERIPMWLSADSSRFFAIAPSGGTQQLVTFDTTTFAELSTNPTWNGVRAALRLVGTQNEVMTLDDDRLSVLDAASAETTATWLFCREISTPSFAAASNSRELSYVAVVNYPDRLNSTATVRVANLQTFVTIGRYSVDGFPMKVTLSSDGTRVYLVTHDGRFITLDTKQRLPPEEFELLCND